MSKLKNEMQIRLCNSKPKQKYAWMKINLTKKYFFCNSMEV